MYAGVPSACPSTVWRWPEPVTSSSTSAGRIAVAVRSTDELGQAPVEHDDLAEIAEQHVLRP